MLVLSLLIAVSIKSHHTLQSYVSFIRLADNSYILLILSLLPYHDLLLCFFVGDTFRYEPYDCSHHMGLGAASHMSSVAEPAEYWLKRGSVIEQVPSPLRLVVYTTPSPPYTIYPTINNSPLCSFFCVLLGLYL